MAYELLSEPIRRYVRDQRWESLRPIQAAAIQHILATDHHYILASRTASGKTEAAFLPILSRADFRGPGVRVLYVSPLIALINDQFERVEALCRYLDVPVTKWHGEASRAEKKRLVQEPRGIVLITPESIEALFVNAPYSIRALFNNLEFVVIDEIHSFLGTDRGTQLQSLLARLRAATGAPFRVVGLSATIGDYEQAKRFTGDAANTRVLLDRTARELTARFAYFPGEGPALPVELLQDVYEQTRSSKTLVFPNSRGRAEELAVRLRQQATRDGGHPHYFTHHSSVDREVREYVEQFAKGSHRQPFCITCTSTLELGIDIGSVDLVVQVDATYSVASLIQRVGRSGRREGGQGRLLLYATDPWNLLQALACWHLYREGYVEPVKLADRAYDILLHQLLSMVKECNGSPPEALVAALQANPAFPNVTPVECRAVLEGLLNQDLLEAIGGEVIIGVAGEKIVNRRDFYSVFRAEPALKVVHAGRPVGEIPPSPQVLPGENLMLAAKLWKITFVDLPGKRVEVVPAHDGRKPLFFGQGGEIAAAVRQRMLEILVSREEYPELDEASWRAIAELRQEFAVHPIQDPTRERPALAREGRLRLYTFAGTRVNRSLAYLLSRLQVDHRYDEQTSSLDLKDVGAHDLPGLLIRLRGLAQEVRDSQDPPELGAGWINFSKWGAYLPEAYQWRVIKDRYFAFDEAVDFLFEHSSISN
jgi:ATP-dependent helicase Lhr and Lhr-like helicase